MKPTDPTNRQVEPNDAPSRAEYQALFDLIDSSTELLDAMAGREMVSVREEYRALSNAVAKARVEVRKTLRAAEAAALPE